MSTFKDRTPFVKVRASSQPFARSAAPYPRANQIPSITKTLLRVVRLTGIIILIGCLHASAGINAQERISINMKSAPLEKVFAEIELRSGYTVFYNTEVLKYSGPVTVEMKDATISDVMRQVLRGLPLEYNIQDKTIFVKHVKPTSATADPAGPGKNGTTPSTVSGIVQTEAGLPLVGATVYIKRLKKMAVTDSKGEVSLKDVPDGEYEVDISYVGFERLTTTISVLNHEAVFTAALKQLMSKLDETVVKGYYTTTNRLNTGDVTTVKGEDIEKQPVSDPILALEGRVPGLNIQQASGVPGAYSTIMIRGQNSIANGNDPLYIVDGVPFSSVSMTNGYIGGGVVGQPGSLSNTQGGGTGNGQGLSPFNSLDPSDIESVEVLKDADATAIYGSRGANGVILINTKKGRAGKTRFSLNAFLGGSKVTRMMEMLNTQQYLAMRREAFNNDSLPIPSITSNPDDYNFDINGVWDTTRYTNWQKALIGNTANFTNLQGDLSGGSANTQFILGGGYSRQGTVFPGDYADQKTSVHFNLTHSSEDQRFHAQFAANYVRDYSNLPTIDFTGSLILPPDAPALFNRDGSLNWQLFQGSSTFDNPLGVTFTKAYATTDNLITNLKLAYEILPGLQLKSEIGYNHAQMNQSLEFPSASQPPPYNAMPAFRSSRFATSDFETWIIEPQLAYKKQIGEGLIEALVGTTFQQKSSDYMAEAASGFASDALISDPLAASSAKIIQKSDVFYHYEAFYGRIGYTWAEKYVLNLTARRDGSSRFGPGKQFGNFGAIGAGWIFSKENFLKSAPLLLSFGKLRASFGTSGNDQIPDYQFLSTYTPISPTYQGVGGLNPTRLTNPNFAWEVVKKFEGGVELGFLKDRILLSASYYRNRTGNQLVGYALPVLTGFNTVQFNLPAILQNTGLELTLNSINVKSKNFSWSSSANFSLPNNKLVAFPNLVNFPAYANAFVVGQSIFIRKVYHEIGVNPQTGTYFFSTKNSNGLPSYPQDLVVSKPLTQRFYGGFENSISYKGLQLSFLIQYVNQPGLNYQNYISNAGFINTNEPTAVLNRWKKPGDLTSTERFGTTDVTATPDSYLNQSDGTITDASFLRLKNVAFSYQFPAAQLSRLHLQSIRLYLQCQNLVTITHYLGLDPETGGLNLPPLRTVTAGIQVGL